MLQLCRDAAVEFNKRFSDRAMTAERHSMGFMFRVRFYKMPPPNVLDIIMSEEELFLISVNDLVFRLIVAVQNGLEDRG